MKPRRDARLTCSFGSDLRATPASAFASDHAAPFVSQLLVLTEKETCFSSTETNVASWYICVGPNVPAQFSRKRNTEPSNLVAVATLASVGWSKTHGHTRSCLLGHCETGSA